MDYIIKGFVEAFKLILSFDKELFKIVTLSVTVALLATIISSIIIVPLFTYIGIKSKKTLKFLQSILSTLMCTPSVLVGLLVFLLLARRGPFGDFQLLYTPKAIIIAEIILISPLIASLTFENARTKGKKLAELGHSLGDKGLPMVGMVIMETRSAIFIAITTGFSRAISEVGAVMIVGGNIKGITRTMTTAISMLNSMGDYPLAIALGIVLIIIAFGINIIASRFREKE